MNILYNIKTTLLDFFYVVIARFLGGFFCVCLFVTFSLKGDCYADSNLILTVDNMTPAPGEKIILTTSISGTNISTILTDGGKIHVEQEQDPPPYEWELQVPLFASGSKTFQVFALVDGKSMSSNLVKVTAIPDTSDLQSLIFDPGDQLYLRPGSRKQLNVKGYLVNGPVVLTEGAVGTTYSENVVDGLSVFPGDSPSISVSEDGKLTALAPGVGEVVATNNGISATLRVYVEKVSSEDSDGDSITDADEDSLGTNKYDADSDGDYCSDDIEIGNDLSNPSDVNKDGLLDALDDQTLVIRDISGESVAIRTSSGRISTVYNQPSESLELRKGDLASIEMPRGVFGFSVSGLTPGETIDVTFYFESLPEGTNSFLKYGPQISDNVSSHKWYEYNNFNINGNNLILHLTDNLTGDDNSQPGIITDPGGPAIKISRDFDGDGIPDDQDFCPDQDSTGYDTDKNGCIDNLTGLNEMLETLVENGVIDELLKNSLLAKISNAEKSAEKENIIAAINQLEALLNEINAQNGKKLSEEAAAGIIDYTESIISWFSYLLS